MSDFKHKDEEQLSRQLAAERLVDVAYALTAGRPLELDLTWAIPEAFSAAKPPGGD